MYCKSRNILEAAIRRPGSWHLSKNTRIWIEFCTLGLKKAQNSPRHKYDLEQRADHPFRVLRPCRSKFPDTGEVIWKFWSEVWWKYSAGLIQRICSATDNTLLGQRLHWGLPRHQGHAPCPEIKRESNCEEQAGIEFSAWSKGRRGGRVSHNPLICQTDKSVRIKYWGGGSGEQRQRLRGGEQPQFGEKGVAAAWMTARGRAPEVSRDV